MAQVLLALFVAFAAQAAHATQPNIVFILVDDQDLTLNSMQAMPKTRKLLADEGITFTNAFCTTPVCCPSRASIVTGKYLHNNRAINNSIAGNCSSVAWQKSQEVFGFAPHMQKSGYRTFFSGKYLNQYGFKPAGGVQHVPPGWDVWRGLVGNSRYYNYTLSVDGVAVKHGDNYETDYLPLVIANHSYDFIREHVQSSPDKPFLAWLSTPSCHDPDDGKASARKATLVTQPAYVLTDAPKYQNAFPNISAPRTPNYAKGSADKHWFVRSRPTLSAVEMSFTDQKYRKRLQSLKTVDDIVADMVQLLEDLGVANNTYIVYTSDHGYHLGQFNMPKDKRQPYEEDVRVPFFVRPPQSAASQPARRVSLRGGRQEEAIVTLIDLAPTFVELAGAQVPSYFDGLSFASTLTDRSAALAPVNATYAKLLSSRSSFLIEYHGEGTVKKSQPELHVDRSGPPACSFLGMSCYDITRSSWRTPPFYQGPPFCHCEDARNNTWWCRRSLLSASEPTRAHAGSANSLYCEFVTGYHEYYDLADDPYQLVNGYSSLPSGQQAQLHAELAALRSCAGLGCVV